MPFDDTSARPDVGVVRPKTALDVLGEVERLLAAPEHWCKRYLSSRNARSNEIDQYCLLGALNVADHGDAGWFTDSGHYRSRGAFEVRRAMDRAIAPVQAWMGKVVNVGAYNDRGDVMHEDVLALLAKVRRKLEADVAAGR